jgi:hypothetical protein
MALTEVLRTIARDHFVDALPCFALSCTLWVLLYKKDNLCNSLAESWKLTKNNSMLLICAATKLGLPITDLTPAQMRLKSVRIVTTAGAALGVLTGCLLGIVRSREPQTV